MNNKKIIPILIVLTIIFTILGATFAYWSWTSDNANKTNITFTIGADFSCGASGGGNIASSNVAPASCTNSTYALQRAITTTITNSGSDPVSLDLWLTINSIGSGLSSTSNFKWALTTDSTTCSSNVVSQGTFQGKAANSTVTILSGDTATTSTYYLYIWLDNAETSTTSMNQSYSMSLGGACTNAPPPTFEDIMTAAALDNSTVDFSRNSSYDSTNGIYMLASTASNTHPVYYYRGNVSNNNVLYADICWKIVRTTNTGGTKLVYNGLPSSGTCNNSGTATMLGNSAFNASWSDEKYIGYMYRNNGTMTDSVIKAYIDNWYSSTLSSRTNELEDTIWCNDRSTASTSGSTINYGAFGRHWNGGTHKPIVGCPLKSDAFTVDDTLNGNGLLTYPVGLLTVDELNMSGGAYGSSYCTYYLCNGQNWHTLSPHRYGNSGSLIPNMWEAYKSGTLTNASPTENLGVRPAISLKPGTTISGGDGSTDRPYTVG